MSIIIVIGVNFVFFSSTWMPDVCLINALYLWQKKVYEKYVSMYICPTYVQTTPLCTSHVSCMHLCNYPTKQRTLKKASNWAPTQKLCSPTEHANRRKTCKNMYATCTYSDWAYIFAYHRWVVGHGWVGVAHIGKAVSVASFSELYLPCMPADSCHPLTHPPFSFFFLTRLCFPWMAPPLLPLLFLGGGRGECLPRERERRIE